MVPESVRIVVVVGHKAELVRESLSHHGDVDFALQAEQMGTGHAVMVCEEALRDHDGAVMILAGDTPLLEASSLEALLQSQSAHSARLRDRNGRHAGQRRTGPSRP